MAQADFKCNREITGMAHFFAWSAKALYFSILAELRYAREHWQRASAPAE
ncbi:hypothetical protein [Martelella mediterranea]|nr:hypothetical protein [Martelella mediterranea]